MNLCPKLIVAEQGVDIILEASTIEGDWRRVEWRKGVTGNVWTEDPNKRCLVHVSEGSIWVEFIRTHIDWLILDWGIGYE